MKFLSKLFVFILLFSFLVPTSVKAAAEPTTERIVYADGSYVITRITSTESRASNTKTSSKDYLYYNANDVLQWKATVVGTFVYDGSTSTCTVVSTNFVRYTTTWTLDSVSKSKSGNRAIGDFYLS